MTPKSKIVMGCAASVTVATYAAIFSGFIASANASDRDNTVYVMSGEVAATSAVVWGRCNEAVAAYLMVRVAPSGSAPAQRQSSKTTKHYYQHIPGEIGPLSTLVDRDTDYTASVVVRGLEPSLAYDYTVQCMPLNRTNRYQTASAHGSFKTAAAPNSAQAVKFTWGADLAGQGWGRSDEVEMTNVNGNTVKGGYLIYDTMLNMQPDFVIHQGDNIYADNAIPPEKEIPAELGGGIWTNHANKDFVAVSLNEFRSNWQYNLGDAKLTRVLKTIPGYFQWDDHEVTNNWYPGEIMTDEPYNGIAADLLAERARQAFVEYTPTQARRIYRNYQHGQHVELFLLDERSFRGSNLNNLNPAGNEMLGVAQLDWFKRSLKQSTATWKVISTHDPLGIVVRDGDGFDSFSNDDPAVLGRELQLAEILAYIKTENIHNVVFLTSDVHFSAAISYQPERATFKEFNSFYEFVIGPLHAGAFGPGELDASFGPEYEYVRGPDTEGLPANSPPPHLQSFGLVEVDANGVMTVKLVDITGAILFEKVMTPES